MKKIRVQTLSLQIEEAKRLSAMDETLDQCSNHVSREEYYLLENQVLENKFKFFQQEQIIEDLKSTIQDLQSTLAFHKNLLNRARALASEEIHDVAELRLRIDSYKHDWHSLNAKIQYVEEMLKDSKKY